jgi:hypothetical protein
VLEDPLNSTDDEYTQLIDKCKAPDGAWGTTTQTCGVHEVYLVGCITRRVAGSVQLSRTLLHRMTSQQQ